MAGKKRGLGRGLDALLSAGAGAASENDSQDQVLKELPVDLVQRGKYQPRRDMDPQALEELAESDILLHVIDITHPKAPEQTRVVEGILKELKLGDRPRLLVANKTDLLPPASNGPAPVSSPSLDARNSVFISAAKGWNLDQLLQKIEAKLMSVEGPLTVAASDIAN